jgi:hypothetical protein
MQITFPRDACPLDRATLVPRGIYMIFKSILARAVRRLYPQLTAAVDAKMIYTKIPGAERFSTEAGA